MRSLAEKCRCVQNGDKSIEKARQKMRDASSVMAPSIAGLEGIVCCPKRLNNSLKKSSENMHSFSSQTFKICSQITKKVLKCFLIDIWIATHAQNANVACYNSKLLNWCRLYWIRKKAGSRD